ncbi:MAG: hypothetical protein ACLGG0_12130 [Bacteriovoracia bacterium]
MKLVILKKPIEMLTSEDCRKVFMDVIELRQRLYREQFDKVLCLDKYDLISDHFIIYDSETQQPIIYMRSISKQVCDEFSVPVPLYESLRNSTTHLQDLNTFYQLTPAALNMSFLCKDTTFNEKIKRLKICNLMIWLAFKASNLSMHELGYCATPNAKYNLKRSLNEIGSFYGTLPEFIHPTVPEPHELVMIHQVSATFWFEMELRFGELFNNRSEISREAELNEAA